MPKPYPAYRDSRVPWLGDVPEHWATLPDRALFAEMKEREHPEEQMLSVTITRGVIRQRTLLESSSKKDSSKQDKSAYKLVCPCDIVYNKMRAWQGAIGVSDFRGIVSPAYVVMRLREANHPRYFHYLFRTPQFAKEAERWSYGITSDMWSLRPEHFKMIYSSLPSLPEQSAIVRYIDHQDRRMRRYIRAKQKLIKLLKEQKQAIIHRTVTRGLDPNVRLKPSGVEWLGDVPEHWQVVRLRHVLRVQSGDMIQAQEERPTGYPIYGGNGIRGYTDKWNTKGPIILLGRVGAKCGCVHLVNGDFWASEHALRVILLRPINLKFLSLVLQTADLNRLAIRTAQPLINSTIVRSLSAVIPPDDEQSAIVEYIAAKTESLYKGCFIAQHEIDLFREYCNRLISDVVTGKLDVREVAARLPDEAEEPEPLDDVEPTVAGDEESEGADLDAAPEEAET